MKNYIEILKKCPLFDNIIENDIITMLHCIDAKVASFHKKEIIIAEGEPAKYIGTQIQSLYKSDFHTYAVDHSLKNP